MGNIVYLKVSMHCQSWDEGFFISIWFCWIILQTFWCPWTTMFHEALNTFWPVKSQIINKVCSRCCPLWDSYHAFYYLLQFFHLDLVWVDLRIIIFLQNEVDLRCWQMRNLRIATSSLHQNWLKPFCRIAEGEWINGWSLISESVWKDLDERRRTIWRTCLWKWYNSLTSWMALSFIGC